MRFTRRRSIRPDTARTRPGSALETLEQRTLLSSTSVPSLFSRYLPQDVVVTNPITGQASPYSVKNSLIHDPSTDNSLLGNSGKIVSGRDRLGNAWSITVHGPGYVVVTDTSPTDGSLDDAIDTIQLVDTNINKTYVTGNVTGSLFIQTDSTTDFNRLIDSSGVRSVILNGFSLAQTTNVATGASNLNTGIYLTGGARYLSFHDIIAPSDGSTSDAPINVVIGDPSSPLTVQPSIHLDSIFNTVFDSTATAAPALTPVTTPSVSIIVNGQIKDLSFISTTNDTAAASQAFLFPTVGTTGRTSVQAIGIDTLDVAGAATNFTASRASQPFQNGFTGLNKLKKAKFHGPTDAVGLDVNGKIGSLEFDKGLGNPTGVFVTTLPATTTGTNTGGTEATPQLPATNYGVPADQTSYAGAGFVSGLVTANSIGKLKVKPANVVLQTSTNPDLVQLLRQGEPFYKVSQGNALTNAAIVSAGNIGKTTIVGNQVNSEIKSGYHYNSAAAGLEGTRAKSKIGPVNHRGNFVNGVTSATYRPGMQLYGSSTSVAGPGTVVGKFTGTAANTGGATALDNSGAGVYAAKKRKA